MARGDWDRPPRMEALPLLDVVFLLLVVFVYSIVASVRADSVPVDLPPLGSGEQATPSAALVVTVDAQGALYAGGERVAPADLERILRERTAQDADLAVLLNADREARHGAVATALDRMRGAGVQRILLLGGADHGTAP